MQTSLESKKEDSRPKQIMAQLYAQAAPPYARRKSKFKEIVAMNDKLYPDRFKILDDMGA